MSAPSPEYERIVRAARAAAFDAWFDYFGGDEQDTDDQVEASAFADLAEKRFRAAMQNESPPT